MIGKKKVSRFIESDVEIIDIEEGKKSMKRVFCWVSAWETKDESTDENFMQY